MQSILICSWMYWMTYQSSLPTQLLFNRKHTWNKTCIVLAWNLQKCQGLSKKVSVKPRNSLYYSMLLICLACTFSGTCELWGILALSLYFHASMIFSMFLRFWIPNKQCYFHLNNCASYGYRGRDCRNNLYLLPTGETVYFIASVVVLYNVEEQLQRHYTGHNDDVKW